MVFGKRIEADGRGQSSAKQKDVPKCNACGSKQNVKRCSRYKVVYYCGQECQLKDTSNHRDICSHISNLQESLHEKTHRENSQMSQTMEQSRVISLIGDKCVVKCELDGFCCEALWDTGGQLSVVGQKWLKRTFPLKEIRDLKELLEYELDVQAADGESIPYQGFVVFKFRLDVKGKDSLELDVPVLVAKFGFETPLIGFNVIKALTDRHEKESNIKEALKSGDYGKKNISDVLKTIITTQESTPARVTACTQRSTVIPPYSVAKQQLCKTRRGTRNICPTGTTRQLSVRAAAKKN